MIRESRIIRDSLLIVASIMVFACAPVGARPTHGGLAGTPSAPVLQDVAVNEGQYTASGFGGVRLSSQDVSSYALPATGLDVLTNSGTACATWTTTLNSGTSGHFNLVTNVAEGTSAITPTPTSAGVSAHLNGGPYVFNVTCKDSNGNSSNTAHLTYNIIAKAANAAPRDGNFPQVNSGYASFATTSGYQILISTGSATTSTLGWNIGCPVQCDVVWADAARPGLLGGIHPQPTSGSIVRFEGLQFTGDPSLIAGSVFYLRGTLGTDTYTVDNVTAKFTPQLGINAGSFVFANVQQSNTTISNSTCEWCGGGINLGASNNPISNITITNNALGHWSQNNIDTTNVDNLTFTDNVLYAPEQGIGGVHTDCFQEENGTTGSTWVVKRNLCVSAGGYYLTQGIFFPGHFTNGTAYMDDGTTAHGAGHIVTYVTATDGPCYLPGSIGSQFFIPGFVSGAVNARVTACGGYTISSGTYNTSTGVIVLTLTTTPTFIVGNTTNISLNGGASALNGDWSITAVDTVANTITLAGPTGKGSLTITSGSTAHGGTKFTLSNVTDAVVGSPASPVSAASFTNNDWTVEGNVSSGSEFNGYGDNTENGTSDMAYFSYGAHIPQTVYAAQLNAVISGTTMTVTGPITSNAPYSAGVCAASQSCVYKISFPGCSACATINTKTSGSTYCNTIVETCVYTLSVAPGNYTGVVTAQSGSAIPANQTYSVGIGLCDQAYVHNGTFSLLNGWSQAGVGFNKSSGTCASPPANTTNTHTYNYVSAPPGTVYKNGDPETTLEAISTATWNSYTPAQIRAAYAHAYMPKSGSTLDNGDGTFASAFKTNGSDCEWYDGTVIAGCTP